MPLRVPDTFWDRDDVRQCLRQRDIGQLFVLLRRYVGASQTQIAIAADLTHAKVSRLVNGAHRITALDVYQRIADGLTMPDHARAQLGIAPTGRHSEDPLPAPPPRPHNPAGQADPLTPFHLRLKQLREQRGLSQRQLAALVYINPGHLSKIENGLRQPNPDLVTALDQALQANGTLASALTTRPQPIQRRTVEIDVRREYPVETPEEIIIVEAADESERHGWQAGQSNVSEMQLEYVDAALARISVDLLEREPVPLVGELRDLRDFAFFALNGRQYPRQSRQLYAIAARACGLLAGAAADRFGIYDAARKHAHTSAVAAELSEAPALRAWIASVECTIAYWQGRYRSAATIAGQARDYAPPGVESARLASLEARAWARHGDYEAMDLALTAAEEAIERDGPSAGIGLIAYTRSNQMRILATALLSAGQYAEARDRMRDAIALLLTEYNSPLHVAAARADLADAHIRLGDIASAAEVLTAVLDSRSTHLAGAARRVRLLVTGLQAPRYSNSVEARTLIDQIERFVETQGGSKEIAEVTAAANKELPQ